MVVAFDWCQWTEKRPTYFSAKNNDRYKINQNACPFLRDIEVSLNGTWQKVATLWTELGAGIDKTWCMVKLENKFCYQDSRAIVDLVISLNSELGIHFKNYNRLDVCGDFQSTDYRNFTPQMFIDKCAKEAYTFKGKKYQDKGQDGKKIKDFLYAECDVRRGTRGVETIRVGQRKSGLSITMYNKTKEMKCKGEKPWVKEQWKEVGFFESLHGHVQD